MQQLPRTAFTRAAGLRVPSTSFRRWNSTEGGEEKVKGQVIGIDLGMFSPNKTNSSKQAPNEDL